MEFNGYGLGRRHQCGLTLTTCSGNAGNYTVVVTNLGGSVTSAVATLTVTVPPRITTQPQNQTVIAGQ